ncbi:MAG: metal ABC transporter permease [Tepidisphaera sp.]
MRTLEFLRDYPSVFWPPVLGAVCLALLCAWLSVLVVLKRLAFIGQGISHAGFGGIGLAAVLGLASTAAASTPMGAVAQFGVVLAFCVAASLLVGFLSTPEGSSRRGGAAGGGGGTHEDTAIGIVLVASMALGSILVRRFAPTFRWEDFLFGYLMNTGWADAMVAAGVTALTLASLWWARRPITFWAFDEPAAEAFGVRSRWVRIIIMTMLALATVTAMRLAGVVLASALLILPGAIALKLSVRSGAVLIISLIAALAGVLGGIVLGFELSWPPGPSIVAVLTALFAAASLGRGLLARG